MNVGELSAKLREGLATKEEYGAAENIVMRTVERRIRAARDAGHDFTITRFGKVFIVIDKAAAYMRGEEPAQNAPRGRGRPQKAVA